MFWRTGLILILCLVLPPCLSATIVITVWTPDALYIGADSKATTLDLKPLENICKVRSEGDLVYAYAGVFIFQGVFDVPTLFKTAYDLDRERKGDAERMVFLFGALLHSRLAEARDRVRMSPEAERGIVPEVGELVLLSTRNGLRRIEYGRWSISGLEGYLNANGDKRPPAAYVQFASLPSSPSAQMEILAAGQASEVRQYQAVYRNPIDAIKTLIGIAMEYHPQTVGGPVSILKMSKDGSREWIEPGVCKQP